MRVLAVGKVCVGQARVAVAGIRARSALTVKARVSSVTIKALPCRHHDVIETPHGPISKARCQKCGRERVYDTSRFYESNVTETLAPR